MNYISYLHSTCLRRLRRHIVWTKFDDEICLMWPRGHGVVHHPAIRIAEIVLLRPLLDNGTLLDMSTHDHNFSDHNQLPI